MPADKVYIGSFESIDDKIQVQLRGLVEAAAERRDSADARRIGDLYASFLDEAGVEKAGADAARRRSWRRSMPSPTPAQLAAAIGRLTRLGANMPIAIGDRARRARRHALRAARSGRPASACRTATTTSTPTTRTSARRVPSTSSTWRACSTSRRPAAATRPGRRSRSWRSRRRWRAASGRRSRTAIRSRPTTGSQLDALAPLAPGFDWARLAWRHRPRRQEPRRHRRPAELSSAPSRPSSRATPLAVWKAYLRLPPARFLRPLSRQGFRRRALRLRRRDHRTRQREPAALEARRAPRARTPIGEALGKLYVEKYFRAEAKARMEKLVANLLAAYRESIDTLDWMGPATQQGSAGQAGDVHAEDRLSEALARLQLRWRSARTTWPAT